MAQQTGQPEWLSWPWLNKKPAVESESPPIFLGVQTEEKNPLENQAPTKHDINFESEDVFFMFLDIPKMI